ncbi:MAG TPA: sterol desaturase family protein [Nevskiaceae bacterium]|nr:sterol desaturase family protein [Nevskiaceae bacterium]
MTTEAERINGREMIAASETAKRNPMRPPDTLPRDAKTAWKVFLSHPSPLMIAGFVVLFGGWRIYYGHFTWVDALLAAAAVAYFPFNEWLIHVFMLHYKPRVVFGKKIDFYLPVTHRRHHADPWNLDWVFIPRHIHALTIPVNLLILWALWPWKEWVLTYLTVYLMLGLHYEWVHYLAHIPWCPENSYYQRRVREHRYHHFRNENFWWGVSMGLGDRVLGTAPAVETTSRSGTTSTLGMNK